MCDSIELQLIKAQDLFGSELKPLTGSVKKMKLQPIYFLLFSRLIGTDLEREVFCFCFFVSFFKEMVCNWEEYNVAEETVS